jgi:hypothetical protein
VVADRKDTACAFGDGTLPDDVCLLALRVA